MCFWKHFKSAVNRVTRDLGLKTKRMCIEKLIILNTELAGLLIGVRVELACLVFSTLVGSENLFLIPCLKNLQYF